MFSKQQVDSDVINWQNANLNCFSEYSNAIYKVFIYWIELAKNKIDTTCHIKLISFIAEEIKPVKSCVKLAVCFFFIF